MFPSIDLDGFKILLYPDMKITGFKNILFFCFFLSASVAWSQNNETEVWLKLNQKYDQEYLIKLQERSPDLLEYLKFFTDNSYYVEELNEKQGRSIPDLFELPLNTKKSSAKGENILKNYDPKTFNIHLFPIHLLEQRQFYKLGHSGKVLVIYAKGEFMQKFNAFKAKK